MSDDIPETGEEWFKQAELRLPRSTRMKIPPDSPTSQGERIVHRGNTNRPGTIMEGARQPSWFWVRWDDTEKQTLCHQSELRLVSSLKLSS